MPTEKLLQLAAALEATARMERENTAALMEHVTDPRIAINSERLAQQMLLTAQHIRNGEFDG